FYLHELAGSRLAAGLVLILVWPLILHLALFLLDNDTVSFGTIYLTGLFLAGLAFLPACVAARWITPGFVLTAVVSLAIFLGVFRLKVAHAFTVWGFQLAVVLLVGMLTFAAAEYIRAGAVFNPITEVPAVASYVRYEDAGLGLVSRRTVSEHTPIDHFISWPSSRSAWLDHYGESVRITATPQGAARGLQLDFLDDKSRNLGFEPELRTTWSQEFGIEPGKRYRLRITGPEDAVVQVTVNGLLRHRLD
ncbi:MAG TPA: hypothetical protein PKL84_18880, partial [Candidatus Hydrogenedentes bacterium]|nr:hypothetical protein [Candidatus Hydrogenedentota bacterium]